MSCDDDVLRLHLELHVRDGTIDGELTEQGGAPVTFAGWIGLTSVLDRAVRRAERFAGAPADGPPPRAHGDWR